MYRKNSPPRRKGYVINRTLLAAGKETTLGEHFSATRQVFTGNHAGEVVRVTPEPGSKPIEPLVYQGASGFWYYGHGNKPYKTESAAKAARTRASKAAS